MIIQYLGTGAAEGFPAVFCHCESCTQARRDLQKECRTRSQVLVDGKLLIDFPADSYLHSLRFGTDLSAVETLLVTHSHTDHFYAQEFVNRGHKFAFDLVSPTLDLYGNAEVLSVFAEDTRREMRDDVRQNLRLHECGPFQQFTAAGYEIFTLPAVHTPKEQALLYCIRKDKTLLYLNDTGFPQEECFAFLKEKGIRADFVSMDCTFADDARPHSGRHMGFAENVRLREALMRFGIAGKDTQFCATHFSHNSAPFRDRLCAVAKEYGFLAAYDGLKIEF